MTVGAIRYGCPQSVMVAPNPLWLPDTIWQCGRGEVVVLERVLVRRVGGFLGLGIGWCGWQAFRRCGPLIRFGGCRFRRRIVGSGIIIESAAVRWEPEIYHSYVWRHSP